MILNTLTFELRAMKDLFDKKLASYPPPRGCRIPKEMKAVSHVDVNIDSFICR